MSRNYKDFLWTPCIHTCIASSIINVPHQSGTCVTIDKPILTYHNFSKSTVYITVHSWCCTFCVFRQMYNDMYPSLWYHTEYFHHPKNLLSSTYSTRPPPTHLQPLIFFTVSKILPFPECHIFGIIQYVGFLFIYLCF